MKPDPCLQLFILISLIDLGQSATAVNIRINLQHRCYLSQPPGRTAFEDALSDLLSTGHLTRTASGIIEVEYDAYGRILELVADLSVTALTPIGQQRSQEAAAYAAQLFVDEVTLAQEIAQEREADQKRIAAERLREEELARRHGFPYDILLQARDSRRGRTHIYVVLLDDSVRKRRGVQIGHKPNLPTLYVGLTGLSPRKRFHNHKSGHKAGRGYVRDYGICLLPHLYKVYNPMPRQLATDAEKALAEKLRREGYTVLGGH